MEDSKARKDDGTICIGTIKRLSLANAALIVFLAMAPHAHAEAGANTQAGFLFGLTVPDADNTDPHQLYGIKGSTQLLDWFGVGGYYLTTGNPVGSGGQKFNYTLAGIEGDLHIPGGSGNTFLGGRIGMTKVRTLETGNVDVIYSPIHYGVVAGYDYYMTSWLAAGFEGSFLHVHRGTTNPSGTSYERPSFNVINFLVSLQMRL